MLNVSSGVAKIDGNSVSGNYNSGSPGSSNNTNLSEQYGRNAAKKFRKYALKPVLEDNHNPAPILDFSLGPEADKINTERIQKFLKENDKYLKALPPLEYEYRYMPNITRGQIDKKALMAAANEEMFGRKEMDISEMDYRFMPDEEHTFKALDINNDGKITNAEYSTSILAADMMSKPKPSLNNIDGTINAKGANAVLEYARISNIDAAKSLYSQIHKTYKL